MNNIENEQILNSAYKKALEQKTEWIFKIQSTILLVSIHNICGIGLFKQFFKGQSLQSNLPFVGNTIQCNLYPFLEYNLIRE